MKGRVYMKHHISTEMAFIPFMFHTSHILSCAVYSFSQVAGPEICSSKIKLYWISDLHLHLCWDSTVLEALFCQMPSWTKVWLVL